MTSRIWTDEIDEHLTGAGHSGYRIRRDSPYTVRVIHEGPDPRQHLDQYTDLLRDLGYTATLERATDIRPLRLRVTHR
ncbi:hypothetical protein OG747_36465 [Streptomyces sp. NBC_01384]|uniref:hypothetical protein n=1 Tax=Streptomyces sp. NBC_01384 TaxID=2903847 RepID=UPI00324D8015